MAGPSAAQVYLGSAEEWIASRLEERWTSAVRRPWQERHKEVAGIRRRLAELDGAAEAGLEPEHEWERIRLCEALGDAERASTLAERLLERVPDHPGVRFHVGDLRLQRGDESGVALIEDAMRQDPRAVLGGCEVLFAFHWGRGATTAAEQYRAKAIRQQEALRLAEVERLTLTAEAEFEPHGIDAEGMATLRRQLERYDILEAYCAQRVVEHLPELPCYVIGIVPNRPWWRFRVAKAEIELRDMIARELRTSEPVYVFLLVNDLEGLRAKLAGIAGARVV